MYGRPEVRIRIGNEHKNQMRKYGVTYISKDVA